MDTFKILMIIPAVSTEISKVMSDRELTIKEIFDIVDSVLKQFLGKGLDEIGLAIRRTKDGKTKIELVL